MTIILLAAILAIPLVLLAMLVLDLSTAARLSKVSAPLRIPTSSIAEKPASEDRGV